MSRLVVMRRRVPAWTRVAAADVTAGEAQSKVNPRPALGKALLASVGGRRPRS